MDAKFLSAVFARPPVVLKTQLLPFCCGHAVNLEMLGSAFFRDGTLGLDELAVAVWVCSQTYEHGRDKLLNWNAEFQKEVIEWGKSVRSFEFKEGLEVFQSYLKEFTRAPERWKKADAKASRAPWALTVVTTLQMKLGISESQAWNMPLQEALWRFAAISEAGGDDSLVTEEERERARIAREAVHV